MIRATDPSGASGIGTVRVNIMNVNEPPVFSDDAKEQTTLYIAEGGEAAPSIFENMDLDLADGAGNLWW